MSATLTNPQFSSVLQGSLQSSSGSGTTTTTINHTSVGAATVGSSSGNVNKAYTASLTVAASGTPTSIDLTSLTDPQGNAISISTLASLKLSNESTVTGQNLLLSTTIANQLLTLSTPIPPNTSSQFPGVLDLSLGTAGLTVDSSHKIIYVDIAAGTNVPFKITLFGK